MTINLLSSLKPLDRRPLINIATEDVVVDSVFFFFYINALDHRRISKVSVRCAARLRHRLQWWVGGGGGPGQSSNR